MEFTIQNVVKFLPEEAKEKTVQLLEQSKIEIKITRKRKTKHGDFRINSKGETLITLNATENPYQFLITLIHEMAHWFAFKTFGRHIKPHGKEWKQSFRDLMLPFLTPKIFPEPVLSQLARHLKNPKASASSDLVLVQTLRAFDPPKETITVLEVQEGSLFRLEDGRVFLRGKKRIKRILCQELSTRKEYLFSPVAEVYLKN